jgi:hypothetical protein
MLDCFRISEGTIFVYTSVHNKFCIPIAYKEPESADYVGVDLACEYGTPAYIGGIFEL